jgi:hypothetical protein
MLDFSIRVMYAKPVIRLLSDAACATQLPIVFYVHVATTSTREVVNSVEMFYKAVPIAIPVHSVYHVMEDTL